MTDWFRSWHGAPTDPKWVLIARKAGVTPAVASAVAWALFDHASQSIPRGSVASFDCEVYAAWGGLDEASVYGVVQAMKDRGMIDPNSGLSNWSKRQPKREDDSADRAKAWRERNRTQENAPERNSGNSTARGDGEEKEKKDIHHQQSDTRDARDRRIETECRKIASELPVVIDQNFVCVLQLLDNDQNLTEPDVFAGITAVVDRKHRLKFWAKLDPWIRRAAQDRLAAAMPEHANYARAGPPNGYSPPRVAPLTPRTQALMDIFNEPTDARDDEITIEPPAADASGGGGGVIGRLGRAR